MAGAPFQTKSLWYRAHKLEELYPEPLDLSKSENHDESFETLENRENLLGYLYHRALKDLIYVDKRYSAEAVESKSAMETVVNRLKSDWLATESARLHAWGGGCWTKYPKKPCTRTCFKGILEEKEDFSILTRQLQLAAMKEKNMKLPKSKK